MRRLSRSKVSCCTLCFREGSQLCELRPRGLPRGRLLLLAGRAMAPVPQHSRIALGKFTFQLHPSHSLVISITFLSLGRA